MGQTTSRYQSDGLTLVMFFKYHFVGRWWKNMMAMSVVQLNVRNLPYSRWWQRVLKRVWIFEFVILIKYNTNYYSFQCTTWMQGVEFTCHVSLYLFACSDSYSNYRFTGAATNLCVYCITSFYWLCFLQQENKQVCLGSWSGEKCNTCRNDSPVFNFHHWWNEFGSKSPWRELLVNFNMTILIGPDNHRIDYGVWCLCWQLHKKCRESEMWFWKWFPY